MDFWQSDSSYELLKYHLVKITYGILITYGLRIIKTFLTQLLLSPFFNNPQTILFIFSSSAMTTL